MNKQNPFTMKEYMYLGIMGAIAFVLAFGLGAAVNLATGIPLTGGIVNGIIVGMALTIGVKGVGKFGSATILALIFSILAIPTSTLGPPGIYKIVVGLFAGIAWDVFILLFRRRDIGYIFGAAMGSVVIIFGILVFALWLGFPAADALKKALLLLVPFNAFLGGLGGYIGVRLFKGKISSLRIMEHLKD